MRRKQSPLTLRGKNLNIPCCSSKSALNLLKYTYCQCIWTVMKKPKCQNKGVMSHLTAFCAFGLSWPGGPPWHSLVLQSRNVPCSAGTEAEGLTPRPVTVPEKELQLNSRLTQAFVSPPWACFLLSASHANPQKAFALYLHLRILHALI